MKPKFSIIIPAYNASKTIESTINSVIKQNFQNWEVIVVENGSTDETNQVVKKYISDTRIQLIHSKKGVSNARNKGIDVAQGDWILFLDADDELSENVLCQIDKKKNDYDLLIGQYEGNTDKFPNRVIREKKQINDYICQCLNNPTQDCTLHAVFFRTSLIRNEKIHFDTNLTHAEDSLFFLHCLNVSNCLCIVDQEVYKYNYSQSSSVRQFNIKQFENYIPTINSINLLFETSDSSVKKEVNSFVLNQVLIVLVNNVFCTANISFFEAIKSEKEILSNRIVKDAIQMESFKYCDFSRCLVFKLMKHHCYFLLALICKIKNIINNRKGD